MKKIIGLALLLVLAVAIPATAANYYVMAIVGSGTISDPYRIRLYDLLPFGECAVDNVANTDTHNWALVKVECDDPGDYETLLGDPQIDVLPMVPFDMKMNSMAMEAMNAFQAMLYKYNIPGNCDREDSCRLGIRCIGQQIDPNWTEAAWAYF